MEQLGPRSVPGDLTRPLYRSINLGLRGEVESAVAAQPGAASLCVAAAQARRTRPHKTALGLLHDIAVTDR